MSDNRGARRTVPMWAMAMGQDEPPADPPPAPPPPAPEPPPPAAAPAPPVPHPAPPPVVLRPPAPPPAACLRLGPSLDLTARRARELVRRGFNLWEIPVRRTATAFLWEALACAPGAVPVGARRLAIPALDPPRPPMPSRVVSAEEAARLLGLAAAARRTLDDAVLRASSPGATEADRAAAVAVASCLDKLVEAAGPLDELVAALESAARARAGARVRFDQADAVQTFVDCARGTREARAAAAPVAGALEAIVGIGLPAAAALAVAL